MRVLSFMGVSPRNFSAKAASCAEWNMSFISVWGRRRQTERQNFYALKLSMVKYKECGLSVACGHINATWCHPTAVCLGGSISPPTHRPSYSCSLQLPNCLSPFCLKLLSDFSGTNTLLASVFLSAHRAFCLCLPSWYLTFTCFTHFFTHYSFSSSVSLFFFPSISFCQTFHWILLLFLWISQITDWSSNQLSLYEMSLDASRNSLFNHWSNRLSIMERMRPVIYPDGLLVEVWGWPAHCGNTTLAFLGIADRFQDHCVFSPPALWLCLLWMACLIIYRKGKGSSWSNKHVSALYFFPLRRPCPLTDIWSSHKVFYLLSRRVKGWSKAQIKLYLL